MIDMKHSRNELLSLLLFIKSYPLFEAKSRVSNIELLCDLCSILHLGRPGAKFCGFNILSLVWVVLYKSAKLKLFASSRSGVKLMERSVKLFVMKPSVESAAVISGL
jgi:hypothetical protein